MTTESNALLNALPSVVLREILSWSPDNATAHAFLSAFHASHVLRQDPSAVALLLLRCATTVRGSSVALASCAALCQGGAGAVVQQLLQLLRAGPDSGGPHTAPPRLLQAMLYSASERDDNAALAALLALPVPPDVNADHGWALQAALPAADDNTATLQALLAAGADPCVPPPATTFARAAESPTRLAALQLLLLHCPPAALVDASALALSTAICFSSLPTVALLLPTFTAAPATYPVPGSHQQYLQSAASAGNAAVLQLLLSHLPGPPPSGALESALLCAAGGGHLECAAALLDYGANVNNGAGGGPLLWAVGHTGARHGRRPAMVRLLLGRGALVTPEVVDAAQATGNILLTALLGGQQQQQQQ